MAHLAPYVSIFGLGLLPALSLNADDTETALRRQSEIQFGHTVIVSPQAGWQSAKGSPIALPTRAGMDVMADPATSSGNGPLPGSTDTAATV
jgi:hypothetical protein